MGQQDLQIHELVARYERGEIRLPAMQRQYVWTKTRVRDLLDSLYRGYPSGTILTWETDEAVETRASAVEQSEDNKRYHLLLDGQQRLTSLSAIIRGKPVNVRGRKRPIEILFNLDHPDNLEIISEVNEDDDEEENADESENEMTKRFNRMAFIVSNKKLAASPNWVSVTEVFRENSNTRFLKAAGIEGWEDPKHDKYTARLDQLRSIRDYSYRVHILDRDKSYEEVTEIFVRVNSLGAKLRSSDLALAQITAVWKGSLEIFQGFEEECRQQGFDLDLGIHMKNLVSFATSQSRFNLVSKLSKERIEKGWQDSKQGMNFALNFLKSNCRVSSPALLSSPFIIILIANYGHVKKYELTPEEENLLRYWALAANMKARYSRGSTETILDQDLAAIRRNSEDIPRLLQLLQTQVGRMVVVASDLENRNSRSAYFKTMFLAFHEREAADWRSQLIISLRHKGAKHSIQFHHIFPQKVLKSHDLPDHKINDICNLAFISGETNRKISDKEPSIYLPEIVGKMGQDALTKQSIPTDPALWEVGAYDDFLARRREMVAKRLNEFLGDCPV